MSYQPNIGSGNVRTLAEWGKFFRDSGRNTDIIELMNQDNTILDDVLWRESTDYDGHRTTVRTGLPQVYWRRLYRGTPVSKSSVATIKDPCGMLEGRSVIDKKMLDIHKSQAKEYRMGEMKAFTEAMHQELATAVFYGNISGNPDGINGLDARYSYKNAPHVIDAGGSGSECTSVWGIVWGTNEVTGIFPKDSIAGLKHESIAPYDAYDEEGNAYRAVGDLLEWNVGLSVRDWRCVVRVCNIPVADLNKAKGEAGFVDLHRLTIQAKNLIPPSKRARLKWYMNQDVLTALELQASDGSNVNLVYRTEDAAKGGPLFNSSPIAFLHGAAVRQNDAILSTETALVAAP